MEFEIPKIFSVGGLTYEVSHHTELCNGDEYGHWNGSRCTIALAETAGGNVLSHDRKAQTFFHELTHAILDSIGEDDLNENEQFIDAFSNALYGAIKTM